MVVVVRQRKAQHSYRGRMAPKDVEGRLKFYKKSLLTMGGLHSKLYTIRVDTETHTQKKRPDRDLLEETLSRLRFLEQQISAPLLVRTPGDILQSRVTVDTLTKYTKWKFPGTGISDHWQAALLGDI